MECIEARALKSNFVSEIAMKSTQQVFIDDFRCVTGINSVSVDDFSVDDLLDFSDKDFKYGSVEEDEERYFVSVSSQNRVENDNNSNSIGFSSAGDDFGSLPAGELAVPVDDWENLEWLSQFVDDSVSDISLLCPTGNLNGKTGKFSDNSSAREVQRTLLPCFSSRVPAKARSKRSRPNGLAWSTESPSLTESSSTSSSSLGSSYTSPFLFTIPVRITKPPAKKQKKPACQTGSGSGGSQTQRRCSHCQIQKTPQWRTGPLGVKTLCNACGVRYKSGRLFPEYRPAGSPTFSGDIHSNSHRKVVEMRRKKEMNGPAETGLTFVIPSF